MLRSCLVFYLSTVSLVLYGQSPMVDQVAVPINDQVFINPLHQIGWVSPNNDGDIFFEIQYLDGPPPKSARLIVGRLGEAVRVAELDSDLKATIHGLAPGAYAAQVIGPGIYAATAIHVLPSPQQYLGTQVRLIAAGIRPIAMREALAAAWVPSQNLTPERYYRPFDLDPVSGLRLFNESPSVELSGGMLHGRLSKPGWKFDEQNLAGMNVVVYRSGIQVRKVRARADGRYQVAGLAPGNYSVLAHGDAGFMATAFTAVEAATAKVGQRNISEATSLYVSKRRRGLFGRHNQECCPVLACELVDVPEVSTACGECSVCQETFCHCGEQHLAAAEPLPEQVATPLGGGLANQNGFMGYGGGFGGGGGGFGGGGFGGGGFGGGGFGGGGFGGGGFGGGGFGGGPGGLLGIAGLAVGAAALADNDDGFVGNLATPIAP